MPDSDPIFSIDRFNLLLRMNPRELKELIESQNLENYARSVTRKRVEIDSQARRTGYRSQLNVVKFDPEIIHILSRSLTKTEYQLNYIELACDVLVPTESDAVNKSRFINKVLRKRWSPEVRPYDLDDAIDDRLIRKRS